MKLVALGAAGILIAMSACGKKPTDVQLRATNPETPEKVMAGHVFYDRGPSFYWPVFYMKTADGNTLRQYQQLKIALAPTGDGQTQVVLTSPEVGPFSRPSATPRNQLFVELFAGGEKKAEVLVDELADNCDTQRDYRTEHTVADSSLVKIVDHASLKVGEQGFFTNC